MSHPLSNSYNSAARTDGFSKRTGRAAHSSSPNSMRSTYRSLKRGLPPRFTCFADDAIRASTGCVSRSSSVSAAPASAALPMLCARSTSAGGSRPMSAALCRFRWLPKPPAMYSARTSSHVVPAVSSRISMPAAIAALASCTARISCGSSATPPESGRLSSSM